MLKAELPLWDLLIGWAVGDVVVVGLEVVVGRQGLRSDHGRWSGIGRDGITALVQFSPRSLVT